MKLKLLLAVFFVCNLSFAQVGKIKVMLQGPLLRLPSVTLNLMRDNLRANPFSGQNVIPLKDPYSHVLPNMDLTKRFKHVPPIQGSQYLNITDSIGVFSVTGRNAIVDWIFVEIRSKQNYSNVIATRSGLLQRDGDVTDLDGKSILVFPNMTEDSFYLAIRHRNHLGVMSMKVAATDSIDFTLSATPVFDFGKTKIPNYDYTGLAQSRILGMRAMYAGDANSDGKVKFDNPGDDKNNILFNIITHPQNTANLLNFDSTIGYYNSDLDLNGKVKYNNPFDEITVLYSQVIVYALNSNLSQNFNWMIEQLPK
jgi:hypothetical protein